MVEVICTAIKKEEKENLAKLYTKLLMMKRIIICEDINL